MRIGVPAESEAGESRVAASPETVKKFIALGAEFLVAAGAGAKAGAPDADYSAAGAKIVSNDEALASDIVLKVRRPDASEIGKLSKGAIVVSLMDPYGHEEALNALAHSGASAFAMELMPRITRAQVMDVLSSQANLAGYRAMIDAAAEFGRALPMMMTPAGTVPAARVFIMGVGVAGLQAIATARRLGAVVTATDVRPATKEQVESLGAKFVAVEDEEFKQAETTAGYAKPMSAQYQAKQGALISEHIAKQDIVITTALIPGRPAPVLVSQAQAKSMRPGSVIIDLAVAQGGNCPLSKPDSLVEADGVKIMGFTNLPARLAADASALYSRNLLALLPLLTDKDNKAFAPAWDDEIIKGALVTKGGAIVHPSLAGASAA